MLRNWNAPAAKWSGEWREIADIRTACSVGKARWRRIRNWRLDRAHRKVDKSGDLTGRPYTGIGIWLKVSAFERAREETADDEALEDEGEADGRDDGDDAGGDDADEVDIDIGGEEGDDDGAGIRAGRLGQKQGE